MGRETSDEFYVLDLCDEILAETGLRQHRFDWPKAALVYQHTAGDRDQLIAERLSARMSAENGRERS
jgi:hypothetical protein